METSTETLCCLEMLEISYEIFNAIYTVDSRYLQLARDQPHLFETSRVPTFRVVILCKLIRMGPIVLFETSRVGFIDYSRYRDSTVAIYIYFLYDLIPCVSKNNLS